MELLQRINLKGTTVVVATHNQAVVDRMRRRVVRLEDGSILHDDERGYYFRGLGQTRFFLGEVFTNFTRNAGMQFTAIGTVAVTIVCSARSSTCATRSQTFGNGRPLADRDRRLLEDTSTTRKAKDLAETLAARPARRSRRALRLRAPTACKRMRGARPRLRHLAAHGQPAAQRVSRPVRNADDVPAVAAHDRQNRASPRPTTPPTPSEAAQSVATCSAASGSR
jgi:hypothetical protein